MPKAYVTKRGGKPSDSSYHRAYHAAAKDLLPLAMHESIHRKARGSAGGVAGARSKVRAKDSSKRVLMMEAELLRTCLHEIEGNVAKSETTAYSPAEMAAIMAAISVEGPLEEQHTGMALERLPNLQAQRLVAGMDYEMAAGTRTPDEARTAASRKLAQQPGYYDSQRGAGRLVGLDVDLASGNNREGGYFGLDTYPYDHGTVIWDIGMGIPFENGEVRNVRWVNAPELGELPGGSERLMAEIARVLMVGGKLSYRGPKSVLDGVENGALEQIEASRPTGESDDPTVALTYQRRDLRAPSVHGADPNLLGVKESEVGLEEQIMLAALNDAPASLAMANLVGKTHAPGGRTQIFKKDGDKQIVYGVVLAPNEVDSQDDYMEAPEIEEAAHHFMQISRVVGSDHSEPIEAVPVESYIAPQDLQFEGQNGPQKVTKGSWVLAVHILDPKHWQMVKDGEYTGFSVGGMALREDEGRDTLDDVVVEGQA